MKNSKRFVDGKIWKLRCQTCGAVFPHFVFSGESDSLTDGLFSASSCKKNEVVIVEADSAEWSDFVRAGAVGIEKRLARQLARDDLRILRLLRIEREKSAGAGLSFNDFKKAYKPPALIYSCVCCADGESSAIEEVAVNDFRNSGGQIIAVGRLVL